MSRRKQKLILASAALISSIVFTNHSGNDLRINKEGLDILVSFEQCTRNVYKDSVGVDTQGCGSTTSVDRSRLKEDYEIAEDLVVDIKTAEQCVNQYLNGYEMNDNQFSATTVLVYNVGCRTATFNREGVSTWLRKYALTQNWGMFCQRFKAFNKAGGVVLKGLVLRRDAEASLCAKPDVLSEVVD